MTVGLYGKLRGTIRGAVATVAAALALWLATATVAAAQGDRSGELQRLVDDLGQQLTWLAETDTSAAQARYAEMKAALDAWNESQRSHADFRQMRSWLRSSIRHSMAGPRQPLPDIPAFTRPSAAQPAEAIADRREPLDEVEREASPQPSQAAAAEPVPSPEPAPEDNALSEQTFARDEPLPASHRDADRETEPATRATSAPAAQPADVADTPPAADRPQPARPAPDHLAASIHPPADPQLWQRHPASRPVDLGNPFRDDPAGAAPANATGSGGRVAMRPTSFERSPSAVDEIGINMRELEARARGYQLGIRSVEARLIDAPDMPADKLLRLAREMQQLAQQREFLTLYIESLSDQEQTRAPRLADPTPAERLLQKRLEKLKEAQQPNQVFDDLFSSSESETLEKIESILGRL